MESSFNLGWVDYTTMVVYFSFVLGIGWALKRYMKSSTDFLEAGRSIPAWITGLSFIATNLGALEVIGMAASGAKYGMATVHFYWIGAIPKMFIPALVIIPGMIAIGLTSMPESGFELPLKGASYDYDKVIPVLLGHYFPTGVLGLGLTALMVSFMSGMAGNVTAFNTVFTYDIYQSYINRDKSDRHYLRVGLLLTIFGLATGGNAELYSRSLGININLWTGLAMVLIGVVMLAT